jgi:gliding motility-associated-like protein
VYHFGVTYPNNPTFNICVTSQAVMPNCGISPAAGNTCAQATLICDVNGYCGSTSATYTADSWPDLTSAFCGSIENNSFIQFVANSATVSLNVWVTSSSSNLGIQVMIFSTPSCGGPVTTHTCVSPLAPSPQAQPVTVNGLVPGNTYYMMIDGYAGDVCNYVIGVNSGIQVSGFINSSSTNVCLGNSITLTAGGGNGLYNWSTNADLSATSGSVVVASPTSQGPHTYTMTTFSNNPLCPSTSVSNITINAFSPPTPNAGIDDSVCFGDLIFLSGTQTSSSNTTVWQYLTNGITPTPTVSFSPNFSSLTPTVTVNQPGLYSFILRETNSVCGISRDTMTVLVQSPNQILTFDTPSCFGQNDGIIYVDNSDAIEYSIDNGITWQNDSLFTGLSSGSYSICSRSAIGCEVCSSITILDPLPIQLSVSNDTVVCQNGTASLFANAIGGIAFDYFWNFTSDNSGYQLLNPLADSIISVYAVNENGCQSLPQSISIVVLPPISGTISPTIGVCPGNSAALTASASGGDNGPYEFSWSTGATQIGFSDTQVFSPVSTTTYILSVTDGCESTPLTLSSVIEVLPLPIPMISTFNQAVCEPGIFNVFSTTDPNMVEHLYWSVSNGQIFTDQEEITTFPLQSGNYDVQLTVTSPQGCTNSANFINYLTVYPQPLASFSYSPNPVTMFNTNVQLNNSSVDGDTYAWYIEEGSPNYSEEQSPQTWFPDGQTGEYNVLLITTSVNGCVDSSEQLVVIAPEVICYAPNTFTPDGDEHNQLWRVFIEGIDIYEFNITIFNRWGELIFESHDPAAYWDGSFNGILVQDGVYSWFIEAKDFYNSKKYTFKGHINVLR